MNHKDVVISLCDKTGNMVKPWANAGFECYCVDIQHSIRRDKQVQCGSGVIHYVWGDVRSWRVPSEIRGRIAIAFAFPPCTHLAVSGARDFLKKGGWMLSDALQLFDSIDMVFSYGLFPFMIENPVERLSSHRRKPNYTFQPWQYGDMWNKLTCLWTGGGFIMPPPIHEIKPECVRDLILELSPGPGRADKRSITPMGFANSVFECNYRSILADCSRPLR